MKISKLLCAFAISALSVTNVMAQQTYEEMEQLTVNEQVTTVITATEPIRFVDISTDKVVGDQPMNNTIRLKPKDSLYVDGEVLAIVTIVTERYRTQYALLYTTLFFDSKYNNAEQYSAISTDESKIPATISVNQWTPDISRPITVAVIMRTDTISDIQSQAFLSRR